MAHAFQAPSRRVVEPVKTPKRSRTKLCSSTCSRKSRYYFAMHFDGILHCRAFVELCCVTRTVPMSLLRFRGALFGAGLEAWSRDTRLFTLGLPFVVVVWAESPGNNRHFLTFVSLEAVSRSLDHAEKMPSNCSNKKGGTARILSRPLIFGQVSDTAQWWPCQTVPPKTHSDSIQIIYRPRLAAWSLRSTYGLALVPQVAE